ncbi:hypothetical protein DM860_018311 [Cuscuta australis]|uniref:Helicase ATP-binding domain-containing protein n=1 Tax=Cuscuta australis TaxID=267555 RepID=A0A328DYR4_9ASTE|nr:hypothetical protein DM860_018311 [Cuscuta australis]
MLKTMCQTNTSQDTSADQYCSEENGIIKGNGDCDHIFILKEDIGTVCRVCGFILQSIETIIDFQYGKVCHSLHFLQTHCPPKHGLNSIFVIFANVQAKKSSRSVYREAGERAPQCPSSGGARPSEDGRKEESLSPHPRHEKLMKPHQIEGFKFLVKNLVGDHPGGCILAHAPGSGKTFTIITFLRSYMSKCPEARPLVVLPKGILSTWKREFSRWQVEEEDGDRTFPLLDFYSARADNRCQQLDVLQSWSRERSVLFLGYKQFSSIVCSDDDETAQTAECRRILLACPSILVLDEGHTPRNEDTDTLTSLGMVRTPRKVVLSGTLYQNSVREVFNIVNLVRPKFMNLPASRDLKRRILSRAKVSGTHTSSFSDREFFDIVEKTLSKDDNFPRKVAVIKDLREMTSNVLHYYKGDFLDELPGLMDFTVLLRLSEKQRNEVEKLKKLHNQRFRVISECSAIYIHPKLRSTEKIFGVLGDLDVKEGAKTKFYLNLLNLCESCGEKLLVFSQYLLPLKFLERLTRGSKGIVLGRRCS